MPSNVKRILRTSFKNSLRQCDIKLIRKSTKRLFSLFRLIDVIVKEFQSNIVYKCSCGNCNVAYYD